MSIVIRKKVADELERELSPYCTLFQVCGSVRRQQKDNGDIDVIVVAPVEDREFRDKLISLGFRIFPTLAKKRLLTFQFLSIFRNLVILEVWFFTLQVLMIQCYNAEESFWTWYVPVYVWSF